MWLVLEDSNGEKKGGAYKFHYVGNVLYYSGDMELILIFSLYLSCV